jgi:hypothetical protein
MRRISLLTLVMICALAGIGPVSPTDTLAQEPLTQTGTTTDGIVAFDYPGDWLLSTVEVTPYIAILGNSQEAFDAIEANGDISSGQMIIIIYSPDFLIEEFGVRFPISASETANLLYPYPSGDPDFQYPAATDYFFGGRPASQVEFTSPGADGGAYFVELGDGTVSVMIGVALSGEYLPFKPTLFQIAQTLRINDGSVVNTPNTPNTPPSNASSGTYDTEFGITFDHPPAWAVNEDGFGIDIAGNANMLSRYLANPNEREPGDFAISINRLGSVAQAMENAPNGTFEEAINTVFQATAERLNVTLDDSFTLLFGNYEAVRLDYASSRFDYIAVYINLGDDRLAVMIASALTGDLAPYESDILALAASIRPTGTPAPETTGEPEGETPPEVEVPPIAEGGFVLYTTRSGRYEMQVIDGWQVREGAGLIFIANTESALSLTNLNTGEVALQIYTPAFLSGLLNIEPGLDAAGVLQAFVDKYEKPDTTFSEVSGTTISDLDAAGVTFISGSEQGIAASLQLEDGTFVIIQAFVSGSDELSIAQDAFSAILESFRAVP